MVSVLVAKERSEELDLGFRYIILCNFFLKILCDIYSLVNDLDSYYVLLIHNSYILYKQDNKYTKF